jgi:hypothetical protein
MLAQSLLRALSNIKGIPGQRGGTVGLPVGGASAPDQHAPWLRMRGMQSCGGFVVAKCARTQAEGGPAGITSEVTEVVEQ